MGEKIIIPTPMAADDVELALDAVEALDATAAPDEAISATAAEIKHAAELQRLLDADEIRGDDGPDYRERVRTRNAAVIEHLNRGAPAIGEEPEAGFVEPVLEAEYTAPKPASAFQVMKAGRRR